MKNFYVQVEATGKIRDIISKPHEGYTEVKLTIPLPYNIMGGSYQLVNEAVIYRPDWDTNLIEQRFNEQKEINIELENAIADLTYGGVN